MGGDGGTIEANKRLIASAPDLLAALEDLLPPKAATDDCRLTSEQIAAGRAAVAKARGL